MAKSAALTLAQFAGLQNGRLARIHVGLASVEVKSVTSPSGDVERRFVMEGPSGVHSLLVDATDLDRLNAHWVIFAGHALNQTLSFGKAHGIAIRLLQNASGFSIEDLAEKPGLVVEALEVLEAQGGEQGLELVEAVYEMHPGFKNYDAKGNWIGPVANENGWTA